MQKLIYPGYMSSEAQEFFKGYTIEEERDGCNVIGTFIVLANNKIHLPSKGDEFIKTEQNKIKLI